MCAFMKKHFLCAPLIAVSAMAPGVRAAVIYSDDFSSGTAGVPVNLNGTSPDAAPGGETWLSRTTATAVTSNGTTANGLSGSTSSLPFTPVTGNIYRVAADISYSGTSSTVSVFGGMGFFNATASGAGTDVSYNTGETTPWIFIRGGHPSGASSNAQTGDISTRINQGNGLVNSDTSLTVTTPVTLSLILDTTVSTAWTLRAFYGNTELDINGGAAGTMFTYSSVASAALASGTTSITSVGLSNSNTASLTASWDNFILETIPEPSSAMLALGGLGLCFIRRRP